MKKSNCIPLADDDQKARNWIREDLERGAYDRTLSRKLLAHFPTTTGPIVAIIPNWVDLGSLVEYGQGSVPPDRSPYAPGDSPLDLLIEFVVRYLQTSKDSVVVCENGTSSRKALEIWTWSRPPRYSYYGDKEVYYILEPPDMDLEMVDAAFSDSFWRWGTAVCSSCRQMPGREMRDESYLNEIVQNTSTF